MSVIYAQWKLYMMELRKHTRVHTTASFLRVAYIIWKYTKTYISSNWERHRNIRQIRKQWSKLYVVLNFQPTYTFNSVVDRLRHLLWTANSVELIWPHICQKKTVQIMDTDYWTSDSSTKTVCYPSRPRTTTFLAGVNVYQRGAKTLRVTSRTVVPKLSTRFCHESVR